MVVSIGGDVKHLSQRADELGYHLGVKERKKRDSKERPVFDSIRKPTAPPSQRFGGEKPEAKIHPAKRKEKHKKNPAAED